MQIDEHDGVLKIAGDVGINDVEELHRVLRDFVGAASRPTVDMSGVESCDTAALQLLTAARKTAERAGKPFDFVGLSPAIVDVSAVLGLSLLTDRPIDGLPVEPAKRGMEDAGI